MDCKIRLGVFVFFVLFKNSDRLFVLFRAEVKRIFLFLPIFALHNNQSNHNIMKKLLLILMICLPLTGMAKDKKDNSDPKYLAGAITMTDGRVTFKKEIKTPGLSQTAKLTFTTSYWNGQKNVLHLKEN